ncbi:MAG TPA: hypothetical protein VHU83_03010, partial [Bryobacteraceae bacterium]|nr:hypothetical protein [Bryobacteraceae bacterium]
AVLPGIVRFLSKTALAQLCAATILLSPVYRFVLVAAHPCLNAGWPFATLSRLDGLAMGVGIALLVRNENCWIWLKRHSETLRLCGIVLLGGLTALTYFAVTQLSMAMFGLTLIATFYALLLLLAICQPASRLSGFLKTPVLQYCSRSSYAIYIFHQGVHGLLDRLVPAFTPQFNAIRVVMVIVLALVVTLFLSELSWRFIEKRLIRRAHVRHRY